MIMLNVPKLSRVLERVTFYKRRPIEYMSLASAIQECIYLEQLLRGVDTYQYAQTKVYEDNQGAIALAKNPVNRQRCKHIDIKYHFIRENVNNGKFILEYCPTEQMIADV